MPKINIARDARGNYRRDLGWKQQDERRIQHRFYLGKTPAEATVRYGLLDQCWEAVLARWKRLSLPGEPAWDETTLPIATALSRGDSAVRVPVPLPKSAGALNGPLFLPFVQTWLYEIRSDFPMIEILPAQTDIEDALVRHLERQRQERLEEAEGHRQDAVLSALACERALAAAGCLPDQTLHMALDAYAEKVRSDHGMPGGGGPSERAAVLRRVVRHVKDHAEDMPLRHFGLTAIEDLIGYWSRRPHSARYGRPMSINTCKDIIKLIRRFVEWLHRNPEFDWRKREDYVRTPVKVRLLTDERKAAGRGQQVQTYMVDELGTLWEYARPLERAMILLGLNCGFGAAEVGSLRVDEIDIDRPGENGPPGSWIRFVRNKSRIYGEFKLWPETVAGVQYVMARRGEAAAPTLFVSGRGVPLTVATQNGNRSQRIPNRWASLLRRVRKDHPQFRWLSFNKLRKTGANLVRRFGDGEVASMYLCHGRTASDPLLEVYTNRPFSKVSEALDRVREELAPVFVRVTDPFAAESPR